MRAVWTGGGLVTTRCPKTLLTGESLALVEAFAAWKRLGGARLEQMEARRVHAFLILERELEKLRNEW